MSWLDRFVHSSIVRKVASNTSWLAGEKMLIMLISLLVSIYLARELGPENWGYISYLLALVALLTPFSSLGLNAVVTRELVNSPHLESRIMVTTLLFRVVGGLIGMLLCLVAVIFLLGEESGRSLGLILALLVSGVFNAGRVVEFWFQSRMENRYVSMLRISLRLFFAVAKVIAVAVHSPMWLVVLIFAFELAFIGLGYVMLFLVRGGKLPLGAFNFSYGWRLLKHSFWLILSAMAAVIYLKIDQVMLAKMQGDASVGIYSVAVQLSEVWFFFPTAFAAAVFPVLLKTRNVDRVRYEQQLQTICDLLLLAGLLLSLAVIVVSPWFIKLVYGTAYSDSAAVLSIHIFGAVLVFMRALVSKWLIAEHLLKYSFWSEGGGAIVNVGLNLLLIPKYGYFGAAIATIVAYFFSCYACFWAFGKTRPVAKIMTRSLLFPFNWHRPLRVWSVQNRVMS